MAEIQHDTYHNGAGPQPVLYGLKCLSKERSGAKQAAARPRRLPNPPGPHTRNQVPPGLDRWEIVLRRASKPGVCSRRAPDSAGGLRRQRAKRSLSAPNAIGVRILVQEDLAILVQQDLATATLKSEGITTYHLTKIYDHNERP